MTTTDDDIQTGAARACGWALTAAAIVSVATMLYHPSVGGRGMDAVREIASESLVANFVHAIMMLAFGALLVGFTGLSAALGWRSFASRAAYVAYAIGGATMFGAATVNGFAINRVARAFLAAGSTDVAIVHDQIATLGALSSTWAQSGAAAQGVAFALWAFALWPHARGLAALGGLAAVPALAAGFGILPLNVHGYLLVVVAQAMWTVAVGVQLIRGRH